MNTDKTNPGYGENKPGREEISEFFKLLQDRICLDLEVLDGKSRFVEDNWVRDGGGGGRSRVILDGAVFEKGGVNFSAVYGTLPEKIKASFHVQSEAFYATGISLVIHPWHPHVPIVHMNLRYFELEDGRHWFGGGIDVTPHYVNPTDAAQFHRKLKVLCDAHDPSYYPRFKDWADRYFFIPHRNETRGIGGIFFDRLEPEAGKSSADIFNFSKTIGNHFSDLYLPIVKSNMNREYGAHEKEWQSLRRSRYVEFNLVYDAGTRFGLETNGRTESILMSLPPMASWKYNFQPPQASPEALSDACLRKGIDWAQMKP